MSRAPLVVPRWLAPLTLVLCLAGIGVAAYLTVGHYTGGDQHLAGCPANSVVNCARVTSSEQSHILGVPVALLGLLYFVGALPFLLPVAWRSPNRLVRGFRQLGAIAGLGFVLWLVYAELVIIHNLCEYCTGVHALTLLLFVAITVGTLLTSPGPSFDDDLGDDVPRRRTAAV